MNLNIRITGQAGQWVNTTAEIIMWVFSNLWYNFISDVEYESRIKWWINYYDIFVSDNTSVFLTKKMDIVLWLDKKALEEMLKTQKDLKAIITTSKIANSIENLDITKTIIIDESWKYVNTALLAWLFKFLWVDSIILIDALKHQFQSKQNILDENILKINEIYSLDFMIKCEKIKISKIWEKTSYIYWNKSIAKWFNAWSLEYFSAYPMTPASSVLTEIINENKCDYLQAEDEIAVINSALWASFTWSRSAVATSGWWFALMTEALSFAVMAEFPITVVLSQRAGPSTGTPTYLEQGDITYALYPTFGDYEHIVLCPSTIEEAHYFAWLALNLADRYQCIVIILVDKQMSENFATYSNFEVPNIDRWEFVKDATNYKRYEFTSCWVSPRVEFGSVWWEFIASSYEHDEYWATSESIENKILMTQKRFKKLQNFWSENDFSGFKVVNNTLYQNKTSPLAPLLQERGIENPPNPLNKGDLNKNLLNPPYQGDLNKKVIVTLSATSYTAKAFVEQNTWYDLIIIKALKPLDKRLFDELQKYDEIIFAELNYSGQLQKYITNELWLNTLKNTKISSLRKYDLMPFYIEDFLTLKQWEQI